MSFINNGSRQTPQTLTEREGLKYHILVVHRLGIDTESKGEIGGNLRLFVPTRSILNRLNLNDRRPVIDSIHSVKPFRHIFDFILFQL